MATGETLKKWRKENQYRLAIDFNRNSDSDRPLIEKLEEQDNKAAFVKGLIKEAVERGNAQEQENK